MKLEKGQKFLLVGDSITDCDRVKPEGEGLFGALGNGYVSYVDGLLQSVYPELGIRVVNKGISGNTVRDLKKRWENDVIAQKPDWLSIMIGINDVWRQYDTPFIKDNHVYIEEYEETLEKLIQETRPTVKGLILMTPYYLEKNEEDAMRQTMDQYGQVVKRIAENYDCQFVNTQAAFDLVLHELYSATLAWDRVHPTPTGHMVITRALLNKIGFDWNK
ncbi:SGNH/GDSL hydrolase family protein [Evansella tamaricis]|uniref:SGNH/GDSL hydrolase family protein n=1 Tax=Evansella tamaricis TaxID=2069301 RepID=A0ABS6JI53_9BACI|nr:SGNH/GDSL hydrolase family protein [Evansella tamaricis]MBU9712899.1 SGNH/GDSL hydrolase family protein [Evansella tamaricis]